MTKEEKLISMLQPKNYKSKIKLYCNFCDYSLQVSKLITKFTKNK